MIATIPVSLYRDTFENTHQLLANSESKVSEVAKNSFQLPLHETGASSIQESFLANSTSGALSAEKPLGAWHLPIIEADSVFLPPVPFILEEETVLVFPNDFKRLLECSLFVQQIVQGMAPGEDNQEARNSLQVNKQAVDLRGFGRFTKQSLEQALKTLRTKQITKQAIEGGGVALLESLSLTETTVFALEEALITEELEIAESDEQLTKELLAITHLNVSVSLKNRTLENLVSLCHFPNIKNLKLEGCTIRDFSAIGNLKHLRELDLSRTNASDISFVQKLSKLLTLALDYCRQIQDFSPIGELQNLKALSLSSTQVSNIPVLPKLIKLNLTSCEQIQDFSSIEALQSLEMLDLSFTNISNIPFMRELPKLTYLFLNGCKQVRNCSGLAASQNLEILELSWTNVSEISFARELSKLNTLNLDHCKLIQDFSVIETHQNLRQLDLRGTAGAHLSKFRQRSLN